MSLTLQRRGLVDEYNGYQFRRESMAQDSAGKLIFPHNARFESGPFGSDKGILVEEGTENLLGTLSPKSGATVTTEITHYTNQPVFYCDGSANWQGIIAYQRVTLTAGMEYTFSVYVYNPSTGEGSLNIQVDSDEVSNEDIEAVVVPPGPGWHRIVRKWSPPANRNVNAIRFENRRRVLWQSGSNQCYMTAPQVEAKPFATSFVNGTRADEALTVPIEGLLSPEQGTIELWYNDNGINKNKIVFKCGDLKFNPVSVTKGWHLISVIWDGVDTNYYIDKELVSTTNSPTELGSLYLGSDGDIDFINSLISHLRLSSIARTQEQLAPLDAPPTVDEYTTLYLPFNGPDNVRATTVVTL